MKKCHEVNFVEISLLSWWRWVWFDQIEVEEGAEEGT